MTNQEAIEAIKLARSQVEWDYPMDYAAAFDKAIEALEQEPTTKSDVPEKNVGKIEPTTKNDLGVDCVSRQEVDRLARIYLKEPTDNHVAFYEDFLELPPVTPQLTSELEKNSKKLEKDFGELDCISRADAIKGLGEQPYVWTDSDFEIQQLADWKAHKEMLENLPPVTPQGTKGYWIDTNDNGFVYHRIYKCSHCGATICEYPENMHESKYKYCSNCGSRNEVEE